MSSKITARRCRPTLFWLVGVLLLAACQREPAELPGARAEPATTVRQLVDRLQENDLVGYARAAVTADQYAQLEIAWRAGQSRWPLSSLPLGSDLPRLLQTLSEPGAEQRLQRVFDAQIAGQNNGIKQAAHSLGLFGVQYLRNQGDYSPEQRAHYVQLVTALSDWVGTAPLADRPHAQAAIPRLVEAARRTGLRTEAEWQALGMEESLRRLGPFLEAFKAVLDSYGLPLDASLAQARIGLVGQQGEVATVRIQYPLAAEQIDTSARLVQLSGHWYLEGIQQDVAAVLRARAGPDGPVRVAPGPGQPGPAKP